MANPNQIDITGISFDEPEEGVVLQSRSGRYAPDKCLFIDPKTGEEKHYPVQGYLVGAILQKADSPKPFWDLEFRLTKPTAAVSGGKLVRLEAGDTVLVTATMRLKPYIEVAKRDNPSAIHEIWLCPNEKQDIGGGQTLWEYKVRLIAQHDPSKVMAMAALLAEKPTAPALPAQTSAS